MLLLRTLLVLFSYTTAFLTPANRIRLLRRGIDTIDDKISCLIESRMEISRRIGILKKIDQIDDPLREEQIRKRIKDRHPRLPPELVDDVWRLLFLFSKEVQKTK